MTFINDNLPLFYIEITGNPGNYIFKVNGTNYGSDFDLSRRLRAVIQYATFSLESPVLAKIEFLDKKNYYDLALNLPILPAVIDITNQKQMDQFIELGCGEFVERGLLDDQRVRKLIAINTDAYMNYICHEFALRYIYAKKDGNETLASRIKNLPFMTDFDLTKFSNSKIGHYPFTTPQFLKFPQTSEGVDYKRTFYMGLQENIPDALKTRDYYLARTKKDFDYGSLDNNLNRLLESYQKELVPNEYTPAIASSNTNFDLKEKEKGQR